MSYGSIYRLCVIHELLIKVKEEGEVFTLLILCLCDFRIV